MNYTKIDGMHLSRLALGTAQLGMDYGIANTEGRPDATASREIVELAVRNGVNCFDTAPGYGDSEKIVGSFLSSCTDFAKPPVVVTKLPPIDLDGRVTIGSAYSAVRDCLTKSIEHLRIDKIPIYLLHRATDISVHNGLIVEALLKLKSEGLIGLIGVSVYTPREVEQALDIEAIQAIQVPVNVFDHRLIGSGLLDDLRKRGFVVFARSIFLQGLVFMRSESLPNTVKAAGEPLQFLRRICLDRGMTISQVCVAFVRDLPGVTSLVLGAEKPTQVMENVALIDGPSLPQDLRGIIMDRFSDLPLDLIDPRTWKLSR